MKLLTLIVLLLLTAPAQALDFSKRPAWVKSATAFKTGRPAPSPTPPVLARVTAYWTGEKGGRISALGTRLRAGHCAVDPRRIPYGSRIKVGRETLTAVDTGKDVRSRKAARRAGRTPEQREALVVDKWFPSRRAARAWVRDNPYFIPIQIL